MGGGFGPIPAAVSGRIAAVGTGGAGGLWVPGLALVAVLRGLSGWVVSKMEINRRCTPIKAVEAGRRTRADARNWPDGRIVWLDWRDRDFGFEVRPPRDGCRAAALTAPGILSVVRVLVCIGSRSGLGEGGAVLAAVKDAARRYAVACGDP